MNRVAVILHGYPAEENQSIPIKKLLIDLGYEVVVPKYMECDEGFSLEWFIIEIRSRIGDNQPEVIVGVSLGGFVLPYIAKKYPTAKIIFVASGARFCPKLKLATKAVEAVSNEYGTKVVNIVTKLPDNILNQIYDAVHKAKTSEDKEFCAKDKKAMIAAIRNIKPQKHNELARYILGVDNSRIIKGINNQALILAGQEDELMPVEVGRELHRGIKNSVKGFPY